MHDRNTQGMLILLANIAVFGMTLKLYTEYFKYAASTRRDEALARAARG